MLKIYSEAKGLLKSLFSDDELTKARERLESLGWRLSECRP